MSHVTITAEDQEAFVHVHQDKEKGYTWVTLMLGRDTVDLFMKPEALRDMGRKIHDQASKLIPAEKAIPLDQLSLPPVFIMTNQPHSLHDPHASEVPNGE